MKAAGVKLQEVPYKGSPPAFTDLLAGRIDLFLIPSPRGYLTCSRDKRAALPCWRRSAVR